MSKKPNMPGEGGSYVRDPKGALSRKAGTKPATGRRKPPADAKPAPDKKGGLNVA